MSKKHHHEEESTQQTVPNKDDIQQEAGSDQPSETDLTGKVTELEKALDEAKRQSEEYCDRLLRNQADFDNFRRRSRQEMEQLTVCAGENLMKKLLPVIDNLERAIASFSKDTESSSWQEGVELTHRQLMSVLTAEGLEVIQAINNEFDPQFHEAVAHEPSSDYEVATVVAEMQKGYKLNGKLLRPSLVKVAVPQ